MLSGSDVGRIVGPSIVLIFITGRDNLHTFCAQAILDFLNPFLGNVESYKVKHANGVPG